MAGIAMDLKSHQAIREEGAEATYYPRAPRAGEWKGRRLSGLRSDLSSLGDSLDIVNLETGNWADASVLIIAGRNDCVSFTEAELARIADFSRNGGGVLLMANHPPDFVEPQNRVCEMLHLPVTFHMTHGNSTRCQVLPHDISKNCDTIHIRRCCRMTISRNPLVVPLTEQSDQSGGHIAAAIDAGDDHGRVVAVASAGHIASRDDSGADLYASASNATWTVNAISWLWRTA